MLNADRPIGDDTHIGMVQTASHEMFHTIQDSYAYKQAIGSLSVGSGSHREVGWRIMCIMMPSPSGITPIYIWTAPWPRPICPWISFHREATGITANTCGLSIYTG